MEISPACEHPIQPVSDKTEHPMFNDWVKYKGACALELVTAMPFEPWLEAKETGRLREEGKLPYQIVNRHPRGEDYWAYTRQEHAEDRQPATFEEWLANPAH